MNCLVFLKDFTVLIRLRSRKTGGTGFRVIYSETYKSKTMVVQLEQIAQIGVKVPNLLFITPKKAMGCIFLHFDCKYLSMPPINHLPPPDFKLEIETYNIFFITHYYNTSHFRA